ncbi:MAG: acyl carrier protein [Elusimicrobiota bacterium]
MQYNEIEGMIRNDILGKNFRIIGSIEKNIKDVSNDEYFIEDLGIDSIGIMALIADVEKVFDIRIEQGELTKDNLGNIDSLVRCIIRKTE